MPKKGKKEKTRAATPARAASRSAPWRIHSFQRHAMDDTNRRVPGREFVLACPETVRAMMLAVLKAAAAAEAPPPMFSGGGKWEAMHGDMNGFDAQLPRSVRGRGEARPGRFRSMTTRTRSCRCKESTPSVRRISRNTLRQALG